MHSFEVHSNDSVCTKSGRLGLEQVIIRERHVDTESHTQPIGPSMSALLSGCAATISRACTAAVVIPNYAWAATWHAAYPLWNFYFLSQ